MEKICGNCIHYIGGFVCRKHRGGATYDAPAICPDYKPKLEDKKMSNYFMLDGKRIPMSNKTAESLRKEQQIKVPMVRKAFFAGEGRIILHLPDYMKKAIARNPEDNTFSFDTYGKIRSVGEELPAYSYKNIEILFEGELR